MYLRRAIESVLEQNYDNLEYIIVDPGSVDGSRNIINEYKNNIKKIIFKPDNSPAEGLNNGFLQATGEIFGYLNSDDVLYPNTLNKVNQYFTDNLTVDIISAHGQMINEKGEFLKNIYSHKFDIKQYLYENCILIQQSTFFKSSIYRLVGGFNENNCIAWDGELMVDIALAKGKFKVIHDCWSGFRIYEDSISSGKLYKLKLSKDYIRLRKKHNFPEISFLNRKVKWLLNWLRQPITLLKRIFYSI
jgi:glycosyltransferase involved in cell wall biosynthesis